MCKAWGNIKGRKQVPLFRIKHLSQHFVTALTQINTKQSVAQSRKLHRELDKTCAFSKLQPQFILLGLGLAQRNPSLTEEGDC